MSLAAPAAPHRAAPLAIGLTESHGWRRRAVGPVTLWFKGHLHAGSAEALAVRLAALAHAPEETDVRPLLGALDGHFALVVEGPGWALAAVDRIRSIPLVWCRRDDGWALDQEGRRLVTTLGLGPKDLDRDAVLSVGLAGFTVGDATLYRGVRQIGPGQFVLFGAAARCGRYHRYVPWRPEARSDADLRSELRVVTGRVLDKLAASAGGRPIAVPLSAGFDSRAILAGLVERNYRPLQVFAYGLPGNSEAETARRVAERLGLPFRFVPYSLPALRRLYRDPDHARHVAYADSLTGVHFPQDHAALSALLADGWLAPDAIIVNGQSGDFITGNHVPRALWQPAAGATLEARIGRVIDALIAKHFKQWGVLATADRLDRIRRLLEAEIAVLDTVPADASGDHGLYEWCEFQDRQSKYVVNGQRVYEHLGLDWRLPLWDDDYLDFWARAPLSAKRGQWLYRDMLVECNWGDVWRDIPLNVKRVRPGWMVPLRLALRAVHVPLGRARWHDFERRYLQYWMSTLCSGAVRPYRAAALDRRRPFGAVALHIEDYLADHGIRLEDT